MASRNALAALLAAPSRALIAGVETLTLPPRASLQGTSSGTTVRLKFIIKLKTLAVKAKEKDGVGEVTPYSRTANYSRSHRRSARRGRATTPIKINNSNRLS